MPFTEARTAEVDFGIQRLLGHKTNTMTQRYAHHSPGSLRDGVNTLDEYRPTTGVLAQICTRGGFEDFRGLNVS